jgi:uncharacterized lipoprotein YmbA
MTQYGWIAVMLVLLAGCASSPPNKYYTLSVESHCPSVSPPAHMSLDSTTIHLPAVLDRPQLVVRTGPQTVDIREFDRWAEPLDQMATRVLADDIAACQSTPEREKPTYFLSVSVDEFMVDTSGQAHLAGRWWILGKGENKSVEPSHSFSLSENVDQTHGTEGVAAMSALLGKLAGEIVDSVLRPEKTTPAASSTRNVPSRNNIIMSVGHMPVQSQLIL